MNKRPYQKPQSHAAPVPAIEKLLAESYAKNALAWQQRSQQVRARRSEAKTPKTS